MHTQPLDTKQEDLGKCTWVRWFCRSNSSRCCKTQGRRSVCTLHDTGVSIAFRLVVVGMVYPAGAVAGTGRAAGTAAAVAADYSPEGVEEVGEAAGMAVADIVVLHLHTRMGPRSSHRSISPTRIGSCLSSTVVTGRSDMSCGLDRLSSVEPTGCRRRRMSMERTSHRSNAHTRTCCLPDGIVEMSRPCISSDQGIAASTSLVSGLQGLELR